MRTPTHFFSLLFFLMASSQCGADIFISFTGLGEGDANTSNDIVFNIGDSGVAYIWFSDDTKVDTGAFLDIASSDSGVIRFSQAETFNPDIDSETGVVDTRWQSTSNGTISDGLVDEMAGVRFLSGTGILPSQVTGSSLEDTFHDPVSNAFLFGSVNFEAMSLGDAVLNASVGDGLIVDEGNSLTPNFRSATISVRAVPEPSSFGLFFAIAMLMTARRTRTRVRHIL
jgi:hypothetical protein